MVEKRHSNALFHNTEESKGWDVREEQTGKSGKWTKEITFNFEIYRDVTLNSTILPLLLDSIYDCHSGKRHSNTYYNLVL